MNTIKATIRNGLIVTDEPVNLLDGTELLIPLPNGALDEEKDWDKSPKAIEEWIKWSDSLEPLIRSEKEEAAAEDWLKACDGYEAEKGNRDIEDFFQ